VLGVSGDSLATHEAFSKEHGIAFPLVDDSGGAIRKLYGGGRVTYLLDRDGIIRLIRPGVPDNRELLEELDRIAAE
jgi:peroxiredoxin Q/BCP